MKLKFKSAYKDHLTYENVKLVITVRDYCILWKPKSEEEFIK